MRPLFVFVLLGLAACTPEPGPTADTAAFQVSRSEVCDGRDNDRDGLTDEGCRSCDMVVTRPASWWEKHTCVLDGQATGASLLPITVGTVTLRTSADVVNFLHGRGRLANGLDDQVMIAKLNRAAFGVGGAAAGDVDGDGDIETLDQAIAYAEPLLSQNAQARQARAVKVLRRFSRSGRRLDAWFDETCASPPELCNGLDDDHDGRVDDACLCDPADDTETVTGCGEGDTGDEDEGDAYARTWYPDVDHDGYGDDAGAVHACDAPAGAVEVGGDCDDDSAAVHPGAPETCNGADDDCDGLADDGVAGTATWYVDADGDGHGDPTSSATGCEAPAGSVTTADDCDDTSASVHPGASETCNGADDDCDGVTDEDAADAATWYADADGDGHGNAASPVTACSAPAGAVTTTDDCDDTSAAAHPGATEVCDGIDDDCDGTADEDDAVDATTWYLDADSDGYGDDTVPHRSCAAPSGYAAAGGDCDDHEETASPGTAERCDSRDNDCDGLTDEPDASGALDLHLDADLDGHGDPSAVIHACPGTPGAVRDASDCDDTRASTWPGAPELCNGRDDDCDGHVDVDAVDMRIYYLDGDQDGYGDPEVAVEACSLPGGYSARGTDCDDVEAAVYPNAVETCDGVDQDCDGEVDDAAADAIEWYVDADGDGHGVDGTPLLACEAPAGTAASTDDCDDAAALRFPGNPEICDGLDNDCDEQVDVDAAGAPTVYLDADGDGYGRASGALTTCTPPEGYVAGAGDCNDSRPAIHPGATDACNTADDDCDGTIDEDATWTDWYGDSDADGFGEAAEVVSACAAPGGFVADATDCDDRSATTWPGADETCDGKDNDCDGTVDDPDQVAWVDWYADGDGDRYGDAGVSVSACDQPRGYVADRRDCDDLDETVHPSAPEQCDEIDNNCDGAVDELSGDAITLWYTDGDGDGHGDPDAPVPSCIPLDGIVELADDCDDTDDRISPDGTEVCDGADDDCDGIVDEDDAADVLAWYRDADEDGAGTGEDVTWSCDGAEGYVAADGDCDDADPARAPTVAELCNGVDDDCDAVTDEDAALDAATWYADADLDGVGSDGDARRACTQPDGWLATAGDCNDRDATVFPGAAEVCNDGDDDCDGAVDEDTTVGARIFYADSDGDGYGALTGALACSTPDGSVEVSGDCDDGNLHVNPDAAEVCNGVDDNCDGSTDGADADHPPDWYRDADRDGFGDAATLTQACSAPVGYVADARDCDDAAATVNPDAAEVCSNGVDDDCDGVEEWCGPYGDRSVAEADVSFPGGDAGDGLGRAVAIAPDLDGDGRDDVIVGGIGIDDAAVNGGGAYVYSGAHAGEVGIESATATLTGSYANGFAGRSVAGVGDVDGDGLGDLLIGAYNEGTTGFEAGAAYFLRGPVWGATPLAGSEARLLGEAEGDWAGYGVDGAGDVDGDGREDLLVAAPYEDSGGSRAGAVYLWYGAPSGDVSLGSAVKLVGEAALDRAGTGMAGLGDVDGDGFDDVAVGAWSDSTAASKAGAAYVLYGPLSGTIDLSAADAKLRGESRNHRAGIAVGAPGDMDGDGLADILVGADQAPAAYLVTGAPTGTVSLADATAKLKGEDALGHAGWAVDGAGDVDGDGALDLLIGAYGQSVGSAGVGMTYLVCGPVSGTVSLAHADGRIAGVADGDQAGYAVAGGGDVDGDGFSDVLIGAWNAAGDGAAAGASYLYYGAARE